MAFDSPFRISLISSQTASSSASIVFTSGISANFSTYLIKIRGLVAATNNTSLLLTFSTNSGSTYLSSNYLWAASTLKTATAASAGSASDSSIQISDALSSTSSNDLNCDIILYDMNSATFVPKCVYNAVCHNTTPAPQSEQGGGMNSGVAAVNALKLAMSSGNIASGVISLFGVNEGGFLY